MKIGITELIVVCVVALVVLGPEKLPLYAKKLGEALAAFKKITADTTKELKESVAEPLEEMQRPLREAMEPLKETREEILGSVDEMKNSFREIGKEKEAPRGAADAKEETEESVKEEAGEAEALGEEAVTETAAEADADTVKKE